MVSRDVHLVRHAQASFGADDYDQLSELGLRQAEVLGKALRERQLEVERVVVGGMRRHRQTAEACLDAMGVKLPLEEERGWDEYDHEEVIRAFEPRYADRTELVADLLASDHPERAFQQMFSRAVSRWASGEHDGDYGEPWSVFCARVMRALHRLTNAEDAPRSTLVFTSGGPILATCQALLHAPTEVALRMGWDLVNASVTRVAAGAQGMRLVTFNEQAHFSGEDGHLLTHR